MADNMEKSSKKIESAEKLTFFGRITAGISHEVNNVNAIIRELAGLMNDLLYGAEQTGQINTEKFKEIVTKILEQTKRGEKNIKMLNRFSHSADHPKKLVTINDLINDITDLSKRFARLKHVTLVADYPDYTCEVNTSPFLLQFAVFSCIDLLINSADEYGTINIGFSENDDYTDISVTGVIRKEDEKKSERIDTIERLVRELNGKFVMLKDDEEKDVLLLRIPRNDE
ncbi:MAG: HAMP domain-containing histidine kinase [bacterium]|nr:HAMP domain-containing histidine kinase [bacterium]